MKEHLTIFLPSTFCLLHLGNQKSEIKNLTYDKPFNDLFTFHTSKIRNLKPKNLTYDRTFNDLSSFHFLPYSPQKSRIRNLTSLLFPSLHFQRLPSTFYPLHPDSNGQKVRYSYFRCIYGPITCFQPPRTQANAS